MHGNVRRYVALASRCIGTVARRAPYRTQRGRGVFALVVRCRVMRLVVYSRVGKNRDTRRESPAGAGADRGASHKTVSLITQLSRHGATIAYTDLLAPVNYFLNTRDFVSFLEL